MRTVLVTGGAGFVGSHLVEALLARGDTVVCVDNMNEYYDKTLKEARLAKFKDKVTFYETDVRDVPALDGIFASHKPDIVCHLAAQAGVRYSIENPFVYAETNVQGTMNILELANKHGVSHVVMASSSSVYGLAKKMPFSEDDVVDAPVSIYAATKRAAELLGHTYHSLYKLNVTCLRFFTVYGPYGRPDMALFKFVSNILQGKPIDVYNNGEMKRDFTYVTDIVDGFVKATEKTLGFEIINLGHGAPVALLDFVKVIEKELGMTANINMMPMQAGDVLVTYADVSKAKKLLGFEAKVSIEEGVKNFVEWYRTYYKKS